MEVQESSTFKLAIWFAIIVITILIWTSVFKLIIT